MPTLERQFTHRLLAPSDLEPSEKSMRVVGVFNPGVAQLGDQTVVIARVVEQPTEHRDEAFASPRLGEDGNLTVDWLDRDDTDCTDPRVYCSKTDNTERLRFISHFRIFRSRDGKQIDKVTQALRIMPEGDYETFGIEDPRITKIGDTFYITYVAVSVNGINTCLMSTRDFEHFERHGVIFCLDNKDVLLFPERVDGDYLAMHRPMPSIKFGPPQIWIARSPDLIHWGGHQPLLGHHDESTERIGGSTPPIRVNEGYLTLYHANQRLPVADSGQLRVRYIAGALLLDPRNPRQIIKRTDSPIMVPEADFERSGFVDDVIFPSAMIERDGLYYVYYGAADEFVGVVGFEKDALLASLI